MSRYSARVDGRQTAPGTSRHSSRWERPKDLRVLVIEPLYPRPVFRLRRLFPAVLLLLALVAAGLAATVMIGG